MELKDVILSTLAEMEDETVSTTDQVPIQTSHTFEPTAVEKVVVEQQTSPVAEESSTNSIDSELMYLNSIRERLLVLFEGFQAPNNSNIEAKVDMTLNFLEYTLATIDSRVQKLEKGSL